MSALENVHYGLKHHLKWLSPQIVHYLRVWGRFTAKVATTPALREKAADGVSAERSSTPCIAAEGELSMARGLCHSKGKRAPDPQLSSGRAPVPKFSTRRAPVHSTVSVPVPEFSPGSPEAHKCPPSHRSCFLHRCRLATLCSPSAHHQCSGSSRYPRTDILQRRSGRSFPRLHLQSLRPRGPLAR